MSDGDDGDQYKVRSDSGRRIGTVRQVASGQWEGWYRNPAGRELTVRASSAVAAANLVIVSAELRN